MTEIRESCLKLKGRTKIPTTFIETEQQLCCLPLATICIVLEERNSMKLIMY